MLRTIAFVVCLLIGLTACGPADGPPAPEDRPTIVCTVGMVTDIVRNVAGDRAEVRGMLGAGIDPHLYAPTRDDIALLLSADIIFYNGLLLEGKMTDALVRAATSGRKVHAVTELIDESSLLSPEDFEGHADPHLWMDPTAWILAVEVVRGALTDFDPDGAATYAANAEAYTAQLRELHAYAQRSIASIPEPARVLVTAHDAFNYLGRRYGLEVRGIQGLSTESEAGLAEIEALVDLLVEREIPAVFAETTVSDRGVRALIAGAAARGHTVTIGGELFSDAMGQPGTYEGTYIGMIDHNITTITRALGGDAPERGMNGELAP